MAHINTHVDTPGFAFQHSGVQAADLGPFFQLEADLSETFQNEIHGMDFENLSATDVMELVSQARSRGLTDGQKLAGVANSYATYERPEVVSVLEGVHNV